jgi:low affinity Fe/Cu permease
MAPLHETSVKACGGTSAAALRSDRAWSEREKTMRATLPTSSLGGVASDRHASWFRDLANKTAHYTGKPVTFGLAVGVVTIWAVTGPIFHYSDTWQLVINTGTTIVTFLMVFLIQATQNRDTTAIHLKLDELIRASRARNSIIAVEELGDDELTALKTQIARLRPDVGATADAAGILQNSAPSERNRSA